MQRYACTERIIAGPTRSRPPTSVMPRRWERMHRVQLNVAHRSTAPPLGASNIPARPVRGLTARRSARRPVCVCLVPGITVKSVKAVNENRVRLEVQVAGGRTEVALEDGLEELGRSVDFPQFKKRRRNAPLPAEMVFAALGSAKVTKYVVDALALQIVCDHAAENGRLVRDDLTADMTLCDAETAYAAFQAGNALRLSLEYDFMERP